MRADKSLLNTAAASQVYAAYNTTGVQRSKAGRSFDLQRLSTPEIDDMANQIATHGSTKFWLGKLDQMCKAHYSKRVAASKKADAEHKKIQDQIHQKLLAAATSGFDETA